MNTKKTAITIVAAMMAIAMITVAMAATCDEPCGTKVTQCTDGAPTKDAVYALMLPGVTPGVPIMQVGWSDTHNPGVFDIDECAYIDTNNGAAVVQVGDVRLCACCSCPANTVVGQCTCTGYNELGRALFIPFDQRIVGYVDMDSDGVYSLPDFLYLDMDNSGFISEGDIRLTDAFGHLAYSIVTNGETEVPVPNPAPIQLLDPATNSPAIGSGPALTVNNYLGFVDSGCDGQWTVNGEDKLYLQQLVLWPGGTVVHRNQFDAFVTIGDLRLYMPPNEDCWPDCGTKVMQCDPDAVYALLIPGVDITNPDVGNLNIPVPAMQFRWVDTNGNQFFDPADHAYIDTTPGANNVEAGDVRLTVTCDPSCGPNTMVGVCGTCDLSPVVPFAALTQQDVVGYFDEVDAHTGIPNGVYDLGDPLYLDIGGIRGFAVLADGVISPGDIRLTAAFGFPAWSVVVAGTADCPVSPPARLPLNDPVSNALMAPPVADDGILLNELLGFIDSDCNGVWDDDADDKLYLQQAVGDLNAPAAPQFQFDMFATIGDLRLFIDESKVGSGPGEPCWLECGTKVEECDVDAVYGLTIPGVTPRTPAGAPVSAMQFGYVDKDGNNRFSVTEGSSPDHQDCAYIDTNILPGAPRVAVGDVRLCSCCGEKPNTVVKECDIDEIGQLLTIPVAIPAGPAQVGLVGYVDVNADPFLPGYDVGEPLYLDCGGLLVYADGMVSEGDIRLTGRTDHGMSYLPYSVVDSTDDDVLGSLNSVLLDPMTDVPTIDIVNGITGGPTFNQYLGFRDSNCDGIWDIYGDDELYLQQIVDAPSLAPLPREFQFNWFSTIGDFRIYMNDTIGDDPDCNPWDDASSVDGTLIAVSEIMEAITLWTTQTPPAADCDPLSVNDIMGLITTWTTQ